MNLNECREKIDSIDAQILALLNRRAEIAREIGMHKMKAGLPIVDRERESAILRGIVRDNPGDLSDSAAERIYRQILEESRKLQTEATAAVLQNGEAAK